MHIQELLVAAIHLVVNSTFHRGFNDVWHLAASVNELTINYAKRITVSTKMSDTNCGAMCPSTMLCLKSRTKMFLRARFWKWLRTAIVLPIAFYGLPWWGSPKVDPKGQFLKMLRAPNPTRGKKNNF